MNMNGPLKAVTVAVALGLAVSGCGSSSGGNTSANGGSTPSSNAAFKVDASKCPQDATKAPAAGAELKIGTVLPLAGPYAAIGSQISQGINAAFGKVNAQGGVAGHKLQLVGKDDGYDPTKTLPAVTELLQQDKVFATVSQVGTANVLAAQPLAEQTCTPQLWAGTGAPQFGDPAHHAWTTSGVLAYNTEAQAWADYLKTKQPGAKVAYLAIDNAAGVAYSQGFKAAAVKDGITIVASEKHAPDAASVQNEVTNLLAAKPDVVIIMSLTSSCAKAFGALAQGGYKGQTISAFACGGTQVLNAVSAAANGAIQVGVVKDPAVAANAGDSTIAAFKADVAQYGGADAKPTENALLGYRLADMLVKTLTAASKLPGGLTRANAMSAAWNMDAQWVASFGGQAKTDGTKDAYAVEAGEILKYDAATKNLVPTGDMIDLEGQTGAFQGN